MKSTTRSVSVPSSFSLSIRRSGFLTYKLCTSQVLAIDRKKAFSFFEDPGNLCDITPVWLDFCLLHKKSNTEVYENAEFDYTIKFMGVTMKWRSRIIDYHPPERFTDIQLKGPYKSWVHLHLLKEVPEGTLMKDEVTYTLHLPAIIAHPFLIRKHLIDIFSYRAIKIAEWADNIK